MMSPLGNLSQKDAEERDGRTKLEEALHQSEELFRLLVEGVKDYAIFMLDPEGRVVTWNLGAERIKGYSADEIIGRHFSAFYTEEAVARAWPDQELAFALAGGRFEDEGWRVRKDGSMFWANVIITAVYDRGRLCGFSKVTRDLTERKKAEEDLRRELEERVRQRTAELMHSNQVLQAEIEERKRVEQALRESEQRRRSLMELMPVALYVCEAPSGVIKFYNRHAAELWGREPALGDSEERFCGSHRLFWPDGTPLPHSETPMAQVLGGSPPVRNQKVVIERPDGSSITALVNIDPITNDAGEVVGAINCFQDVTERERLFEELRQSEERFRRLVLFLPAAVYTTDREGRITLYNDHAAELWGRRPEIGEMWCGSFRIFEPDGTPLPHDECPMALTLREGRSIHGQESLVERPDGTRACVLEHPELQRDLKGNIIGAVNMLIDISDRKRAEEELRNRVEEIEKLMEVMPVAVWIARDRECRHITGNLAGYELLRMPPGSNLSKTASAGERLATFRIFINGKEAAPEELPMQRAAALGVEVREVEETILFDDGTVLQAFGSALPLFDEQGKVRGCIAAFMDVSELRRLERELRQKVDELAAADRRKNEFLATLAHELRNPLAPIRHGLELLHLAENDAGVRQQARSIMERQVGQMIRLVDDLLDVSRITSNKLHLRKERIELVTAIQSAVETARPLIDASGHELTVRLPPEPAHLEGDLIRLSQIFTNLLNNAAKYTEPGGHISVTAERDGREVVVSVRDTGIGIAAEHLPHLFEIFTQVRPPLERPEGGLGIGLSLVRGLVGLHGGTVEARSDGVGRGSVFTVRLPVAEAPPTPGRRPPAGQEDEPWLGPKCRILVADDNQDAADSLGILLEMRGYEVRTAHDGLEAMQSAAAFQPDVALLDIGMPKMNGYEVAFRLRQQPWSENVVLVAVTGWGQEEDKQRAMEAGFDHHLTKPVDPAELEKLLASIRRMILPGGR